MRYSTWKNQKQATRLCQICKKLTAKEKLSPVEFDKLKNCRCCEVKNGK